MKDLNNLLVFMRVAETRSFTEAARQLGMTPSAVSKAVKRMEQELAVRLFHRTTRSVHTTNEGASFLERCRSILSDIEEAESELGRVNRALQGRLRVQIPVALGHRVIAPALREFAARYPQLVIDVELSDRVIDLAYEGFDAAVVIGPVTEHRLIARKLCDLRFYACASPAYLAEHGEPRSVDDLERHRCLAFIVPQTGRYREWQFSVDGQTVMKPVCGPLNFNHGESMLDAAVHGLGIAMLSSFMAAPAVRSGALQVVLGEFGGLGPPVSVVFLERRHLSARVRAFVDFITELIPERPAWDEVLTTTSRSGVLASGRRRGRS